MSGGMGVNGIDLDEIERLATAATEGPWALEGEDDEVKMLCGPIKVRPGVVTMEYLAQEIEYDADAQFIAASREAVPALVAEIQALRAVVQERDEQIGRLVNALQRTEGNFMLSVHGKPVRDMCENLAENRAALAGSDD